MFEPSIKASKTFCREASNSFSSRTALAYFAFDLDERFIAAASLHNINWRIPRFELGFWWRSSLHRRGYMREAAEALIQYALSQLGARRIDCITDERNQASRALCCCSLGMKLEGILHNERITPAGELRNTCIYAIA